MFVSRYNVHSIGGSGSRVVHGVQPTGGKGMRQPGMAEGKGSLGIYVGSPDDNVQTCITFLDPENFLEFRQNPAKINKCLDPKNK